MLFYYLSLSRQANWSLSLAQLSPSLFSLFLGGVPVGSSTSTGDFVCGSVCLSVCYQKLSTKDVQTLPPRSRYQTQMQTSQEKSHYLSNKNTIHVQTHPPAPPPSATQTRVGQQQTLPKPVTCANLATSTPIMMKSEKQPCANTPTHPPTQPSTSCATHTFNIVPETYTLYKQCHLCPSPMCNFNPQEQIAISLIGTPPSSQSCDFLIKLFALSFGCWCFLDDGDNLAGTVFQPNNLDFSLVQTFIF